MTRTVLALMFATVILPFAAVAADDAGWVNLCDGKTLDGWTTGDGKPVTAGWTVEDGVIHRTAKGGDIYTAKDYGDFELEWEWKISEGGNSGVKYRMSKLGGKSIKM